MASTLDCVSRKVGRRPGGCTSALQKRRERDRKRYSGRARYGQWGMKYKIPSSPPLAYGCAVERERRHGKWS